MCYDILWTSTQIAMMLIDEKMRSYIAERKIGYPWKMREEEEVRLQSCCDCGGVVMLLLLLMCLVHTLNTQHIGMDTCKRLERASLLMTFHPACDHTNRIGGHLIVTLSLTLSSGAFLRSVACSTRWRCRQRRRRCRHRCLALFSPCVIFALFYLFVSHYIYARNIFFGSFSRSLARA